MTKRMLLMLGVVIAFIAIIGGFKYFQIKKAMAGMSYQPPPEAVTTVVARQEEWNSTLKAIGTVAAVQGVTVSADLPGVVERIEFDSGRPVSKGQILVVLDAKQERAQLASAEAQLQLDRVNLERMRGMMAAKIIPEAQYDAAAAEAKQADAKVAELTATIARKTIRAPFDGVLGLREINLGQYLAGGAPIVSLQSLRPVYVNFSVPQQEMSHLGVGSDIEVDAGGVPETGKVTAFGAVIDEATRNGQVQASFANRDGKLRPGMFVDAHFAHGAKTSAITLPVSAISYAPFGDSVFIVEDVKGPDGKTYRGVRQQFVKLGDSRGDQVAVLTGVKPGEEVVTSGVFKLRPGAAVQVNNSVQPGNSPKPRPEDS
ncbi:MAG TPA: efflux RND transporter periplasmic adaptor subunit [Thermoanaerobaculia bacterium]|jgi:membrane fusion protein (multidrug efflux system)|nr:efflux RND transporter periplasmic adaptor subunit [Thermoanaerobaculia bacterium]